MTTGSNDDNHPGRPAGEGLGAASEAAPSAVRAQYDDWVAGGEYDDDVAGWGYDIPERLTELIVAHFADHGTRTATVARSESRRTVLDAGCGTGRAGAALRRAGFESIVGGDFSETSLAVARERDTYTAVVPLDLNQPLSFDDARFDAVLSSGVFSYVADSEPALRELLRVVEVGGLVTFSQRTDLWESRAFGDVLAALTNDDVCTAEVTGPVPYLPGHPDFGEDVGVRLVQLTRRAVPINRRVV